jgi:hypothetical protein
MIIVKCSNEDFDILSNFIEEDPEEKFISSIYEFLAKCARESYIEEDLPPAPKCARGSKKRSIEAFYYAL